MASAYDNEFPALPPPARLERMESNYYHPLAAEIDEKADPNVDLRFQRQQQALDLNQKPNDDQTPNCLCGKRAAAHQIKKEDSKDKGKWFFVCAKRRGDPTSCPFWELQGGPAYRAPDLAPSDITCDCRKQAAVKTSVKPGKNQNRQYYACVLKQCQFFRWAKGGFKP
jgi:hypothetical protein